MRRPTAAEVMLLVTVSIWAFNFTVTRYALTHGFEPLAYSALRFAAAAIVVSGMTYGLERSIWFKPKHAVLLGGAALIGIYLNQVAFVYSIDLTNASTVALIFGSLPILTAIFAYVLGVERLHRRFWIAAGISFAGVALVAAGSSGGFSGNLLGDLLALVGAATWGFYSVAIVPLLRLYSVWRISAGALLLGSIPLVLTAIPQLVNQRWDLGALVWAGFAFAVLGPLVLTNILCFTAIERVGPSRATLVTNLQPFLAALFAVALLSEDLTVLQVAGGIAIGVALLLARRRPAMESA
ncbi:MAG: DMT family transporter [Actinomycetota bacterium]|nr:DMT family transporter [Actinomycetota bacterium]